MVLAKPAGWLSQPAAPQAARTGAECVQTWAKDWIRAAKGKVDGEVFCGIVHRLDRNTSGVLVLARTSKAASRLSEQWAGRRVRKVYLVIVEPAPALERGRLVHALVRDELTRVTRVLPQPASGAAVAELHYTTRGRLGDSAAWLEVELGTGRAHQIRAQLSHEGHPLWGDRKYGSPIDFPGLALHAWRVELEHPTLREPMSFEAPVPCYWPALN